MKVLLKSSIAAFVFCLFFASFVQASTVKANNWYNEATGVKTMKLWVTTPEVSIKSVSFNKDSLDGWSWSYSGNSRNSVILTGPATSGIKDVLPDFKFTTPSSKTSFAVEWAEIGGPTVLTGTNFYENKKWTFTKGEISNSSTPLPGALLLMGGGLSVLAFLRRKFAK
ncbi:hypothetical protein [Desulfovibrio gilichinskyi]|uniref:PEP-CTERM protein-sorting domain-containing protein n=1 Tax=Desulfovibrio gilichinskyi TaxID=1519643 RepID=A0A1X7F0U3_9BACT|nr:hypothetical protein [Desulfovibrio gilichinskyi]SMF43520.1 PEP-CTERM protein-sorting domain-containing protein [Desulfovibrio gilichinskyi]